MKRGIIALSAILVVGIAGAVFFFSPTTGEEEQGEVQPQIVIVNRGSLQTRVSETGSIQPSRTMEIKSQFSGEISQLYVSDGQTVEPSQLLAIIQQESKEARQVAQYRAEIQEEGINVEKARRELVRMQSLHDKGYIARKNLELAQQDYRQSLVRLELSERRLLLALGGSQELYKRYLARKLSSDRPEEFEVRSPSAGTVLEVLVQPGEIIRSETASVAGGTVLMRIADLTSMVVKAKINEVSIARVKVGQPVDIRLDALPGRQYQGKVLAIAAQGVSEETNNIVTYEVTIAIEKISKELRPMLTANVDILTDDLQDVLTVPLETLRAEDGDDIVEVLVNGEAIKRKVRVAFRTESQAVIVDGLEEGEQVVIPSYKEKQSS